MYNLPVHWSEGMFLQPHHLQAAERHWSETAHLSGQWDHQYFYGIRHLQFSQEAIGNSQFQVNVCHARMKDGTVVALDPGQEPDRIDLSEAFAEETTLRIFLAVPKLQMGSPNVAVGGASPRDGTSTPPRDGTSAAGKQRFVEVCRPVQEESFGGNEQELSFRDLNVCLLLSTQDTAGYEILPIAQVQRAGEKEAAPQLDVSYIPPNLAVEAWPPLGRDIVRAIYDIVGKKIGVLSQQVLARGITLVSQEPGDMDRLMMLHALNSAYGALGILTFASGVHPFTAYFELCRLVGQLSIFRQERRPPEIPSYDHDDLGRIFNYIKAQLLILLDSLPDYEYEQRWFEGEGQNKMRVSLESRWLESEWQWFVGVQRENLEERECLMLLSEPGGLNWKLGSADKVESLFTFRHAGLNLRPMVQAPRALPPARDWIYFQVNRDNDAWRDVLRTQSLAMRLADELIVNRGALQGNRRLTVKTRGREGIKQGSLQFALFAVPNRQPAARSIP